MLPPQIQDGVHGQPQRGGEGRLPERHGAAVRAGGVRRRRPGRGLCPLQVEPMAGALLVAFGAVGLVGCLL